MHEAAYNFIVSVVQAHGLAEAPSVLDLGGRDVNGTVHGLFHSKPYVVDILDGPEVDWVGDAAEFTTDHEYDVVLCTEVFEHTPNWPLIVNTAWVACRPGGMFIATMASRERPTHSPTTGGPLESDTYYANIDPVDLVSVLGAFHTYAVIAADGYFGNDDLYCWAIK